MKKVKAVVASAMALTLAAPTTILMSQSAPVQAAEGYPDYLVRYTFDDLEKEGVELVDNEAKPSIQTDTNGNKYLELKNSISQQGTEEVWDATQEALVATPATVYTYSTANIKNPYNDPEVAEGLKDTADISGGANPVWSKGVTIAYWQKVKAAEKSVDGEDIGKDSAVVSFSSTRENVGQADTRVNLLMYDLIEEKGIDDPIFSLGTINESFVAVASRAKYRGLSYTLSSDIVPGSEYTLLEDPGMFACFNEECDPDWCYMKPILDPTTGEITSYEMSKIKYTYKKDEWIGEKNIKAVYGTAHGGLQFNSSGAWAFVESDNNDLHWEKYEKSDGTIAARVKDQKSLVARNHVAAHAFIKEGANNIYAFAEDVAEEDGGDEDGLWESPMYHVDEWQFVVRVIKNDSISTYIDGVLVDEMLYSNKVEFGAVDCGQKFNVGWGYNSILSNISAPGGSGTKIYENGDALFLDVNGDRLVPAGYGIQGTLGYNGNVTGITILDMLTDANTTLSLGGQSLGVSSAWNEGGPTGTSEGTGIDDVTFFDVILDGDEIQAFYEAEVERRNSYTPPTPTPGDVTYGDLNGDNEVTLEDARIALQIALRMIATPTADQIKAGDVVGNGDGITLADAQAILKKALRIPVVFDVEQ